MASLILNSLDSRNMRNKLILFVKKKKDTLVRTRGRNWKLSAYRADSWNKENKGFGKMSNWRSSQIGKTLLQLLNVRSRSF